MGRMEPRPAPRAPASPERGAWVARTVLAIVVVALALLPLVREPSFYY